MLAHFMALACNAPTAATSRPARGAKSAFSQQQVVIGQRSRAGYRSPYCFALFLRNGNPLPMTTASLSATGRQTLSP